MKKDAKSPIVPLSTTVARAGEAKAAKAAKAAAKAAEAEAKAKAAAAPSGPQLAMPTVPLKLRARITPALVERMAAQAAATTVTDVVLGMPIPTYLAEAVDAALMVDKYWEPTLPRKHPSLSRYAKRLGAEVAPELVHLVDMVESAGDDAQQAEALRDELQVARARFVHREIRLAAELVVDDGVRDHKDVVFEALQREHANEPGTIAALASALGAYVRFGQKIASELGEVPDFEMTLLEEGELLRDALRARRKTQEGLTAIAARSLRNSYLELIRARLAKIRAVVRYAYRGHPKIVREATSAFLRERRRAEVKAGAVGVVEGGAPEAPVVDEVEDVAE